MMNSNKQISLILFVVFVALFVVISFRGANSQDVFDQDDQYYEDVEENTDLPDYEDPDSYQDFSEDENQNPDPEFMEEQEPGEYDQSDDTTELTEDNY